MCEILDLNPRLQARLQARKLSTLHSDHVDSDNALRGINEALRELDEKIIKAEHVALYGDEDEAK